MGDGWTHGLPRSKAWWEDLSRFEGQPTLEHILSIKRGRRVRWVLKRSTSRDSSWHVDMDPSLRGEAMTPTTSVQRARHSISVVATRAQRCAFAASPSLPFPPSLSLSLSLCPSPPPDCSIFWG